MTKDCQQPLIIFLCSLSFVILIATSLKEEIAL